LVAGFASLIVMRLVLGIGESVAYPAYSKILAKHYGENERGLSNALIDIGAKCGPAVGTLAGGILMARYGWRPFFVCLGLGAMIWLPFWIKWMPRGRALAPEDAGPPPSVAEILVRRDAWATFAGLFCSNYLWYFMLNWLPYYLVRERHFSMHAMAYVATLPLACTAAATALAGCWSYRAIARGASPTRVRKTCTVAGMGGAAVIVAVPAIQNDAASIAILVLACVAYGTYTSSHWSITQTIAGPHAAGRWTGLQNFIGNLSGIAAPAVTGFIVQETGQFFWAFAVSAGCALVGAGVYLWLLGPVVPAEWSTGVGRDTTA
jgi:MFS family permease